MAEYFTHFSCVLPVATYANAERALELYHDLKLEYGQDGMDVRFVVTHEIGSPDILWIRNDESGDPEHVIEFVRRCGAALRLSGYWGFEWANTCNRPEFEAFGGGAHVLDLATGRTVNYVDTHDWLVTLVGEETHHA